MEKRSNDPDNIQGVRDDQSTCSDDDDGTGSDQKARSNSSTNVSEEDNASVGDDNFPQSGNVIIVRSYDDTFDKRTTDDGCTDGNGFEKNSMNAHGHELGISSRASGNCGDSTSLVGSVDGDGGLFAAFRKQNCGGGAGNPGVGRFDSLGGSTCDVLNATVDNGALLDDNHSGVKVGRNAAYVEFACHVEDENDNNNDKDSDDDDDDDVNDDDDDDPGAQYHPEEMMGCPETNELIVFAGKANLSKGGIFHEIDVEIVTYKLTLKTKI